MLRLERLPRATIFAIGLALMAVIALGAGVASAEAGYDELFLLPVVSVAWLTSSTTSGVTMVALATGSGSLARHADAGVVHPL